MNLTQAMQKPRNEDVIVTSGKHTGSSQMQSVIRSLHERQLLEGAKAAQALPNPGLVNLVTSQQGRVDHSRRNISVE